jgi:Methyltransferase domain
MQEPPVPAKMIGSQMNPFANDEDSPTKDALTTPEYWNNQYTEAGFIPRGAEQFSETIYLEQVFKHLEKQLRPHNGAKYIELGCGGSTMIPRLYQHFSFEITGLDFTPNGCESARVIARAADVPVSVELGDFFDPPPELLGAFDVVGSYGVAEHFTDTAATISYFSKFAKIGGLVVTTVPCMKGFAGKILKLKNEELYRKHHPLNEPALAAAHAQAGLKILASESILGLPVMLSSGGGSAPRRMVQRLSSYYLALEARNLGIRPNRWTSPYALCVAQRSSTD